MEGVYRIIQINGRNIVHKFVVTGALNTKLEAQPKGHNKPATVEEDARDIDALVKFINSQDTEKKKV